jgi:hypothetical protein
VKYESHDPTTDSSASVAHAVSFATTEHFNLQTARALTVTESTGRANIYLAALSSSLIVLAFVGQQSGLGAMFHVFGLLLLPVLTFIGLVTFLRLVQSSVEDIAYAHRIALLRDFYLEVAPQLRPFLVTVSRSDARTAVTTPRLSQLALTVAGMVAVINSVLVGNCVALALSAAQVRPPWLFAIAGAAVCVLAFGLQEQHHRRVFDVYRPDAVDLVAIAITPRPTQAPDA